MSDEHVLIAIKSTWAIVHIRMMTTCYQPATPSHTDVRAIIVIYIIIFMEL